MADEPEIDFAIYRVPPVPADLADRVEARLRETAPRRRGLRTWSVAALAVAALVLALVMMRPTTVALVDVGERHATEPTDVAVLPTLELHLGSSAHVAWRTLAAFARVEQRAGAVSYDIGSPTAVATAAGDIYATSARLTIDVEDPMTMPRTRRVTGALVVTVALAAGTAWIASPRGEVELAAGQRATLSRDREPVVTPAPAPTASARVRRVDARRRGELLAGLARARASLPSGVASVGAPATAAASHDPAWKGGALPVPDLPPRSLDADSVRDVMQAAIPLVSECYGMALDEHPELEGQLDVEFTISGEPEVGGLVADVALSSHGGLAEDATFAECVKETVFSLEFPPPEEGGDVVVRYPFQFTHE